MAWLMTDASKRLVAAPRSAGRQVLIEDEVTQGPGPSSLAIAAVKVCCSCRTCRVPPQTKHTARSHLEDCPGSVWLAMGVVDGGAGL